MLCDGWGWATKYCAATDTATIPNGFRQSRFEYQMKIVLTRWHLAPNRLKCWNFGNRKPDCPSVVLRIGLCRVIRILVVIIRTGTRLLIICGENINGRGVGCRARLSLHIPQAQVVEYFFDYIGIFNKGDHMHLTLTLGATKGINFINLLDEARPIFSKCYICEFIFKR